MEKTNIDIKALKIIYDANRQFLIPIAVVFISIILVWALIIPQIKTYFATKNEAKTISENLKILNNNLNTLQSMSDNSLDSNLSVLNQALPLSKDFVGILNALDSASLQTGVGVEQFSFQIGDLNGTKKDKSIQAIDLSINLTGDTYAANSFIDVMEKTVPLSEISILKTGDNVSTINISFFYKPLEQSLSNLGTSINPLSKEDLVLIKNIENFNNISASAPPIKQNIENQPIFSSYEKTVNPFAD